MFESFKQISSITSPLKFFEKNYSKEGLEALYVDYLSRMPQKDDETWYGEDITVNYDNQTWIYKYEVQIDEDQDGLPITEVVTKNYSFENEILLLLKSQYQISINLIKLKLNEKQSERTKSDMINNLIKKCLLLLDTTEKLIVNHDGLDLNRPICSILRFIYTVFNEYAIDQKKDKRIGLILKERDKTREFYKPYKINPELADSIIKIKSIDGVSLIKYQDDSDKVKMKLFFNDEYDSIETPVILLGEVGIVSYFLHKVIQIKGLTLRFVEKKKMFKINKDFFVSSFAYSEKHRISIRNYYKKDLIDEAIDLKVF